MPELRAAEAELAAAKVFGAGAMYAATLFRKHRIVRYAYLKNPEAGGEGDVFRSMLLHLPSGPSAQESEASLAYKVVAYKVRSCLPHMHGLIERVRIDRLTDNKLLDMPQ